MWLLYEYTGNHMRNKIAIYVLKSTIDQLMSSNHMQQACFVAKSWIIYQRHKVVTPDETRKQTNFAFPELPFKFVYSKSIRLHAVFIVSYYWFIWFVKANFLNRLEPNKDCMRVFP